MAQLVTLKAMPQPLTLDLARTALVVVDMQNDFCSPGGMFHHAGIDISGIRQVIPPVSNVLAAARQAGIKVIFLKMAFREDLSDIGAPGSANRERHHDVFGIGRMPDSDIGKPKQFLIRNTWGTEIVEELKPKLGETVICKHRFSGFFRTELDSVLQTANIRQLLFVGCTTSVCVDSTIRDAAFRDYQCALLADCTSEPIGEKEGRSSHDLSVQILQTLFCWVSSSGDFLAATVRP